MFYLTISQSTRQVIGKQMEKLIGQNVERNGRGLIKGTVEGICLKGLSKTTENSEESVTRHEFGLRTSWMQLRNAEAVQVHSSPTVYNLCN
jgi:hypothetical protein